MRPNDIKQVIEASLKRGSGSAEFGSVMIWGPPGVGKSEVCAEVAKERQVRLIDFRLTLMDPTELKGYGWPDVKEGITRWLPPEQLPRGEERAILFFDDLTTAPPLVQAAAYQLTLKPHRLGEYQWPEESIIIAAGNRVQDS